MVKKKPNNRKPLTEKVKVEKRVNKGGYYHPKTGKFVGPYRKTMKVYPKTYKTWIRDSKGEFREAIARKETKNGKTTIYYQFIEDHRKAKLIPLKQAENHFEKLPEKRQRLDKKRTAKNQLEVIEKDEEKFVKESYLTKTGTSRYDIENIDTKTESKMERIKTLEQELAHLKTIPESEDPEIKRKIREKVKEITKLEASRQLEDDLKRYNNILKKLGIVEKPTNKNPVFINETELKKKISLEDYRYINEIAEEREIHGIKYVTGTKLGTRALLISSHKEEVNETLEKRSEWSEFTDKEKSDIGNFQAEVNRRVDELKAIDDPKRKLKLAKEYEEEFLEIKKDHPNLTRQVARITVVKEDAEYEINEQKIKFQIQD